MSARSTRVNFENATNCCLILVGSSLQHGIWNGSPPGVIAVQSTASWQNDSDGFMTGDQGSASYAAVQVHNGSPVCIGYVVISWDNPYVGSNSYSMSAPAGLSISYTGGGGNNATINVTLKLAAGREAERVTTTVEK